MHRLKVALQRTAFIPIGQSGIAETELLAGYRGLTDPAYPLPDAARNRPSKIAEELVRLYTSLGKPDEVNKWQAERAKYRSPKEVAQPPPETK